MFLTKIHHTVRQTAKVVLYEKPGYNYCKYRQKNIFTDSSDPCVNYHRLEFVTPINVE